MNNNVIIGTLQRLGVHTSKKRKVQFIFLLILTFLTGIIEILSIASVLPFVKSVTDLNFFKENFHILKFFFIQNRENAIIVTGLVFAFLYVVNALSRCALIYLAARLSNAITAEIAVQIYKAKLGDLYINHISKNSSTVITAVTQKVVQTSYSLAAIINFISSCFLFLCVALVLIWVNPKVMLIIMFSFASLYFGIIKFGKKTLKTSGEIVNKAQDHIVESLRNGLGAIRDIIIDKTQDFYVNIFQKASFEKSKKEALIIFIQYAPRYIFEGFAALVIVVFVIFWTSFQENINDIFIIFPTLAALAIGAQKIIPLLNSVYLNFSIVRSNLAQVVDVVEILDQYVIKKKEIELTNVKNINFANSISFQNVFFRYNKNQQYILENVNFKIKKGSRVGIIGKTGEGKSTLLDLIMGLLSPDSGRIKIDDITLCKETIGSWQSKIAHVPQNIFLSDSSFLENIAFGVDPEKINVEKVKLAAKKSQCHDFIMKLEKGYDEIAGERGAKLSGGQIQRLGLARALYKNAEVIIFDEATNSLDYETEKLIIDELNHLDQNLTVIIVAHRLNTLEKCDLIFEIQDKQVNKELSKINL
jgi:ABC-type multidrug transport system fused ATPase/permease subunit